MSWKQVVKLVVLAGVVIGLDCLSKTLTHFFFLPTEYTSTSFPFGGIAIFRNWWGIDFCIHHVTNRGAAWGIGGSWQDALLMFRIVIISGLIVYLFRSEKARLYRYPLMLILAGGVGNIFDYFVYGHVIDMFHFFFWGYSYPVFNIADISIFFGIIWLLFHSLFARKPHHDTLESKPSI